MSKPAYQRFIGTAWSVKPSALNSCTNQTGAGSVTGDSIRSLAFIAISPTGPPSLVRTYQTYPSAGFPVRS